MVVLLVEVSNNNNNKKICQKCQGSYGRDTALTQDKLKRTNKHTHTEVWPVLQQLDSGACWAIRNV